MRISLRGLCVFMPNTSLFYADTNVGLRVREKIFYFAPEYKFNCYIDYATSCYRSY